MSPSAQEVLEPYRALVLDDLRALLNGLDLTHVQLLREHLDAVEEGDPHAFDAAALLLLAAEAMGQQSSSAMPVASALALLFLTTDVLRGLYATRIAPAGVLESAWGMPRTLNAADAFYALSQQSLLRLREQGRSSEDVMKASSAVRTATLGLCEDLLKAGASGSRQPIRAALALAVLSTDESLTDAAVTEVRTPDIAVLRSLGKDDAAVERLQTALESLAKERFA